jgi:geranylgeranyl reductase family protein
MYSAIVIGLGPAGSTAAYTLARAGHKVIAFDKETFPRYKSCGGCLSTKVEGLFDFDISGVFEETVVGGQFTYKSSRPLNIISERTLGYNVMRDRFDHLLVEEAEAAGAEIVEGCRVRSIVDRGAYTEVTVDSGETYKALFVIGADGASGFTGRELFGLSSKKSAVSITAEVEYDPKTLGEDITGKIFLDFGTVPWGYAWIFPKEKYLSVGVAGEMKQTGDNIKEYFEEFVSSHSVLKQFDITERTGWTVPLFYDENKALYKGRVCLAGDTGHLVDPFLGEGIYNAVLTGRAAANTVAKSVDSGTGDLSDYQQWLDAELLPEFVSAEKIANLIYKYPRLWFSILEKDTDIMQRYYDVIRGEESAEAFYAWVFSKVKSKPWKMLRRWVGSVLMPA